ncbi:hypothetical protein Tco_0010572 [Tanacetum coccineum]
MASRIKCPPQEQIVEMDYMLDKQQQSGSVLLDARKESASRESWKSLSPNGVRRKLFPTENGIRLMLAPRSANARAFIPSLEIHKNQELAADYGFFSLSPRLEVYGRETEGGVFGTGATTGAIMAQELEL